MQPAIAMPDDQDTLKRKDAHLELCATGDVEPADNDPLFADVHLVHEALPELAASDVDLSASFLGKKLRAPLLITGMTGGTARAQAVNLALASVADELGIAFGVGSQRAMLRDSAAAATFQVRAQAPKVALLGNLGLWQAVRMPLADVRRLVDDIGADGLAIHLNAGQELVQPEGDRDFQGGLETLRSLAKAFGDRLVVKETGCGIGPRTARLLLDAGVKNLDVSGLGGTSWVKVEALRASGEQRALGEEFQGWGIPTAACIATVAPLAEGRALVVASGGIRDGLMAAKALALGADLVGMALPVFRAFETGGRERAKAAVQEIISGVRLALALTGSKSVTELRRRRPVVTGQLKDWVAALG